MENYDFDSILKKYEDFKKLTNEYNSLLNYNYFHDEKSKISLIECGTFLRFGIDKSQNVKLQGANFCRKRICPMCQWRKAEKQFSNCLKLSDMLEKEGYKFLHLVLTVPNCEEKDLKNTVSKLYNSFSKFWKYREIKRAFKGCLRCFELTYNYENFNFHPHLHCLIAVKKSYFNDSKIYLSYEKLRELWTRANNSDVPLQISIGAIKNQLGFAEVSKYCVKPLELDPTKTAENITLLTALLVTLKGTRFIQTYGIIKEYLKIIKGEKQEEFDNEQMFDYHWNYATQKYEIF